MRAGEQTLALMVVGAIGATCPQFSDSGQLTRLRYRHNQHDITLSDFPLLPSSRGPECAVTTAEAYP
jgi:hypothetical protein